jgi:hypothetical protein
MRLDSSGNLGIGTSSPGYKLEASITVAATTGVQDVAMFRAFSSGTTNNTFGARLLLSTQNPNGNFWPAGIAAINDVGGSNLSSLGFYTATSGPTLNERMRLDSSGNLLIGTTTSAGYKLEVAGVAAATDFNSTSDRTKKTNITTIPNALEKVQQLRGVEFDWLDTGAPSMGLIAQEVAQVIPQVVQGESGNMTLSYGNLVGLLIEAVKAQQQQISELQTAVAKLTKE